MIQENKDLLLKDLCARLPYGVKIHLETLEYGELIGTLDAVYPTEERVIVDELDKAIAPINVRCGGFKIEENKVKPYLRPMSSMTDDEKRRFSIYTKYSQGYTSQVCLDMDTFINPTTSGSLCIYYTFLDDCIDWLNKNHFDYRGLIKKGLALEAPKGMYNLEKK